MERANPTAAPLALAAGLAWIAGCTGDPPPPTGGPDPAHPALSVRLVEITRQTGLVFEHDTGEEAVYAMPRIMGSGAALLDHDGDGDLDIYLVTGPGRPNQLFARGSDGTYRDVTDESGLGDMGYGMGAAVGDYDNDGDADVYVTNYGPDALYRNNGDGTFTDATAATGIDNQAWACSAGFVDYDLDGHLDLFVANYVHYPEPKVCSDDAGRPEFCGPLASPPTRDVLFHNNGDGTFDDVSAAAGIARIAGRGLGVMCEDFDGDGDPDVYVANDGEANFLWLNNGDGTFTESATELGAALNAFASTEASMGVTAGDIDADGDLDLFMTHLSRESNTLYRNDGTGGFDDVTAPAGLAGPSFPLTGFGTAFVDLDNDGALDLVAVNGRVKRGALIEGVEPTSSLAAYAEPNLVFRNDGSGRFADISDDTGPFCGLVEVSRGLAAGDIDNDGDLDLLVSNCHGPARLFRNDTPQGRGDAHWLIVRAVDPARRRDAYGAVVTVTAGGRVLRRTINPGHSYASSGDHRAHFGLGAAVTVEQIEIRWPDGHRQHFGPQPADRIVTLIRGTTR